MQTRLLVTATTIATALAGIGLGASSATAASTIATGRVTVNGLVAHHVPTTAAPRVGSYQRGTRLGLNCKVHGPSVGGNDIWYSLHFSDFRWVSARYVANVGAAPRWCGDGLTRHGRVTTSALTRREGPSLASRREGTVSRGTRVSVVCHVPGLKRDGVTSWYELSNGSWISARYVSALDGRPALCA